MASNEAARMDAMQEANENWDRQAAINAEDEERLNMLSGEEESSSCTRMRERRKAAGSDTTTMRRQSLRRSNGRWIVRGWKEISKENIVKSFEVCALTTPIDGSGDDKITCFKPDGSIGTKGLQLLKEFRAQQMAGDGSNDSEDAGIG